MKYLTSMLFMVVLALNSVLAVEKGERQTLQAFSHAPEVQALTPEMVEMGVEEFLTLTPELNIGR